MLYSYLTWDAEICFDITDEKREIYNKQQDKLTIIELDGSFKKYAGKNMI